MDEVGNSGGEGGESSRRARALMVLGTSSHVGKSLVTAALCRIFAQQGCRVAPFKSQNMSLNSAATVEGLEIGRAQALQAEAAGVAASVHMNPILIKPSGEASAQIVAHGRIWGQVSASEYHLRRVEELLPMVRASYDVLAEAHEVIVLEGAGSPAEINLKQHDIVNMRMAEMADARCVLVADIDRGGVFASLLGTIELLEPEERERIGGFIINKFRGDLSLLEPGVRMIEQRLNKPCLGIVPYLHGLALEEEDSVGLPMMTERGWASAADASAARRLRIAVVALPSFSNFTDFDSLREEESVELLFCRSAELMELADVVVLPGSKQTVDDLDWMRRSGLDRAVTKHAESGLVVGICGGMQMLGEAIADPEGIEREGDVRGLGLLPIRTIMRAEKVTRSVSGMLCGEVLFGQRIATRSVVGYEIHVGETIYGTAARPFATLAAGAEMKAQWDGCLSEDMRVMGSYLHGVFDDDAFRHAFLLAARAFRQLSAEVPLTGWKAKREESLNRLAAEVSKAVDLRTLFGWVGQVYAPLALDLKEAQ
ncbi:MAG TPA: cobyric acid synthase [Granulicella sp.]|jgi:adenosylcobyric acid synthase|nr:cobyric acid synthase [Granulicella sp.]